MTSTLQRIIPVLPAEDREGRGITPPLPHGVVQIGQSRRDTRTADQHPAAAGATNGSRQRWRSNATLGRENQVVVGPAGTPLISATRAGS